MSLQPATIEAWPARRYVGVQERVVVDEADWAGLWRRCYAPRSAEVEAAGEAGAYVGCAFCAGIPGSADYLMGMFLRDGAEAAEGLTVRAAPAATYALFECAMPTIGATWGGIYGEWLPTSGYEEDTAAPCIELYRTGSVEGAVPVLIGVPVRPAA